MSDAHTTPMRDFGAGWAECWSFWGAAEGAAFGACWACEGRGLVGAALGVAGFACAAGVLGALVGSDACPAPPKLGASGAVRAAEVAVPVLVTPGPAGFARVTSSALLSRKESEKPSYSLEFISQAYPP